MGPNHYLPAKFLKIRTITSFKINTHTPKKKKKPSLYIIPIPNAEVNELAILFRKKQEEKSSDSFQS